MARSEALMPAGTGADDQDVENIAAVGARSADPFG